MKFHDVVNMLRTHPGYKLIEEGVKFAVFHVTILDPHPHTFQVALEQRGHMLALKLRFTGDGKLDPRHFLERNEEYTAGTWTVDRIGEVLVNLQHGSVLKRINGMLLEACAVLPKQDS